jgi:lipopolysaccharide export system permease protein
MIAASIGVAALLFVFNETVVIQSSRTLDAWSDADYEPIPPQSDVLSNVWIRDGNDLVRAKLVGGRGPATKLRGVTIYDREEGALARVTQAESADQVPGAWRLEKVRTYDARTNMVSTRDEATALVGVEPERFTLARVDPAERDFVALREAIHDLEAAGRPTEEARTGWWHKISGPLSTILMPLLAATAAFGLARSGKVLLRATIGMALGFAYFVADNFSIALGNIGAYPPFLAAWAPFLLFLLIGELVLVRQEE